MPEKPDCPQYKTPDEYDVGDHLAVQQARNRNQPSPKIERPEWTRYRAEVLEAAGIAAEERADEPKPPQAMDTDEHFDRIREERRPG